MVAATRVGRGQTNVVLGTAQLDRALSEIERRAAPQAMSRAMNRKATTVRAESARDVAKRMGLPIGQVKKQVNIVRATREKQRIILRFKGKPLPLLAFKARQRRRGVSAKAWGRRRVYKGTFIAQMPNGKIGVFQRTGRGRLPIEQLFGPGVAKTALAQPVQDALAAVWRQELPREFERQLAFYVDRIAQQNRAGGPR